MPKIKRRCARSLQRCPNEESNGYCYGKFPSAEPPQAELFPDDRPTDLVGWLFQERTRLASGGDNNSINCDIALAYALGWIDNQFRARQGPGNGSDEED